MFDLDLWREIFQSISKNKLRTLLSGGTVIFAIMLFAILFGLANGLQNTFSEGMGGDAENTIFINSGRTAKAGKGNQVGRRIQFDNALLSTLKDEFKDDIEFITARVNKNVVASYKGEKNNYSLRAVNPDHQFIEKSELVSGRFINQRDLQESTKVIVIGRLVKEDLFKTEKVIGEYIDLNKIQYKVVGVYQDIGDDNEERIIYMPLTTAQRIYGNNDFIDQINLTYNLSMGLDNAIALGTNIESRIKKIFNVEPSDQRAVRIRNRATEANSINQFNSVLDILIWIIGLGTLIAGIVGISNIMIFIVKERTKEIGIRKALGAPPRSIQSIILIESVLITSISGYVGLLLGIGILEAYGPSLDTYFITDPSVDTKLVVRATLTLIISGFIAAYIPAKRASQIKPIIALRDE
ncbi:MAG: ABC transporter permease [Flavobacteriales bacterium]|nr:ABC transporter ATP-binding protein [Flavobacteriaceae bacterium]RZP00062.1 MAG: ABC transporter permease [Flavobacteriales bacterium]